MNNGAISYQDVLQNGYAQEYVLVTTDSSTPITGTYQLEGELAPWIRLEPANETFVFSSERPYQVAVIVEPPADAQLRRYAGSLRFLTGELTRTGDSKIGQTTRAAFLIKINAGLTGTEMLRCQMGGVAIIDTEVGDPFDLVAGIHNTGNVRITPSFNVLVYDQEQTTLLLNTTLEPGLSVLPTTTREYRLQVPNRLPIGQYWARVTGLPCGNAAFLTFDVVERGGIADKGELVRITVSPWARTGDIVPIQAVFKNTGPRIVTARFKGTITQQDTTKLFKVIDTESVNVLPGQTVELETFFNPLEAGQYVIAGRVNYNSKITFQKSAILNVNGPTLGGPRNLSLLLLFLLLAIVILVLLILIAKKRREREQRRRGGQQAQYAMHAKAYAHSSQQYRR